jgi:hypothetical protein
VSRIVSSGTIMLKKKVVGTPTNRLCLGLKSATVMMRAARESTTATITKNFPVLGRTDEIRFSRSPTTVPRAAGSRNSTNATTRGHWVDQSDTGTQARL